MDAAPRYIEKNYWMDPETEDLIRGHQLKNGMTILVEDPKHRASDVEIRSGEPEMIQKAETWNRWITVSEVDTDIDTGSVLFIAIYENGAKRTFTTNELTGWFVKKDSIPSCSIGTEFDASPEDALRLEAIKTGILNRVQKAMITQDSATFAGDSSSPELDRVAQELAEEIFLITQRGFQSLGRPIMEPSGVVLAVDYDGPVPGIDVPFGATPPKSEPDPIIIVTGRDAVILRDGNGGAWAHNPETD